MNPSMNQGVNEWMNQGISEWMNEMKWSEVNWSEMNEWMIEWMNWMKDGSDGSVNHCIEDSGKQFKIQWVDESMAQWIGEWMN